MPRSRSVSPVESARAAAEALRRIVRALRLSATAVERRTGISGAQLFVLRTLADRPGLSLGDLARATSTDLSSVSVVVRRLVERGLVRRRAAVDDARKSRLDVTAAGARLLRGGPQPVQERLLAARALPAEEVRWLERSLGRVVRAMGAEREPASFFFEDAKPVSRARRAREPR